LQAKGKREQAFYFPDKILGEGISAQTISREQSIPRESAESQRKEARYLERWKGRRFPI
jgi:hypothetical protein